MINETCDYDMLRQMALIDPYSVEFRCYCKRCGAELSVFRAPLTRRYELLQAAHEMHNLEGALCSFQHMRIDKPAFPKVYGSSRRARHLRAMAEDPKPIWRPMKTVRLVKVGNCLMATIPRAALTELKWLRGDVVAVQLEGDSLRLLTVKASTVGTANNSSNGNAGDSFKRVEEE